MDNNNDNLKNNNPENSKMSSQRKTLNVGLLDTTNLAEAQARDIAKAKMTKPIEEKDKTFMDKTLVTKFVKNIWKNNIAQGYYEQREFNNAKKAIFDNGDLYIGEKDFEKTNNKTEIETKLATKNGLNAILDRFLSKYEDEQLSQNEKSTKEVNKNLEINGRLSELVKSYATGTVTEKDFIENQNKIFFDYDQEYGEKGKMYATNLLEIARNVKDSYMHGKDLANLDFDLNFTYGKANQSLKTEAKLNSFEKAMSLMQKNKIGRIFVNEPVAVAVAAGIYSGVTSTGTMVAKSKISQWATFGASSLLAGAVFGAKESFRIEEERAQHAREKAKGMTFEGKRREEMEKHSYETKSAKDIIATLDRDIEMLRRNEGREVGEMLADLADLEARRKLGDEKKIDLIAYTDFARLEQERTDIGEKIGEMKVLLRKIFGSSDPVKFQRDFDAEYVDNAKNRLIYGERDPDTNNEIKNGIEAKDKAFKSMKRWRIAGAVAKGTFVSATLGFVAQEVGAFFQDKTDGIIEGSIKKMTDNEKYIDTHTTALEGLRRYVNHENISIPFGHGHEQIIANAHVDLPQDVNLVQMPNGTYFADYNGDAIAHHIPEIRFNPDGTLVKECKDFFDHNNIVVDQYATTGSAEHIISQNPHQFIAEHSEKMQEIADRHHYDNNTSNFDKNELKLWWGGENNAGVNENGDVVFDVKHMFKEGSFHGNDSVNADELIKDGKMKILLSMTKDSINDVFEINVDKFGHAIIPRDIPKELFSIENGHAVFHGYSVEAVHTLSESGGKESVGVLATYLGENNISGLEKTIPGDIVPHIKLTFPTNWDYEVPYVMPTIPRNPLERGSYLRPIKNNSINPERTTQTEKKFKVNDNVQKEPIVNPEPKNKEDHERFIPKQQDVEEAKHKTESNSGIFTEEEMKRRRELFGRYS